MHKITVFIVLILFGCSNSQPSGPDMTPSPLSAEGESAPPPPDFTPPPPPPAYEEQASVVSEVDNSLSVVNIGEQIWMQENLDADTFRNGDLIPHAKTSEEWEEASENKAPAWCYYGDFFGEFLSVSYSDKGKKFGKLYNLYAANDSRGIGPVGWRVPSVKDYEELYHFAQEGQDGDIPTAIINLTDSKSFENALNSDGYQSFFNTYDLKEQDFNSLGFSALLFEDANRGKWCTWWWTSDFDGRERGERLGFGLFGWDMDSQDGDDGEVGFIRLIKD